MASWGMKLPDNFPAARVSAEPGPASRTGANAKPAPAWRDWNASAVELLEMRDARLSGFRDAVRWLASEVESFRARMASA